MEATDVARAFFALFKDQESDFPVEFAAFRKAFGIEEEKAPLGPLDPGTRISMPLDDPLYLLVADYRKLGLEKDRAEKARKTVKAQIVVPMGSAQELFFPDGTSAVRRQVTRKAFTMPETTYEELRVTWKG